VEAGVRRVMETLLNVLLTAGVLSVIADAIITSVRASSTRNRELKGLLRMLYMEVDSNRRRAEWLLELDQEQLKYEYESAPQSKTIFEDDLWKEARVRLAQLLPNAEHFNKLNSFYANNATHQESILNAIKMGFSFKEPENVLAATLKTMLEQQADYGAEAVRIISQYIGEYPFSKLSYEESQREAERINMERLQRQLDPENDQR
jgi:endonuclease/exonuclease/phosphatase (EEP) superfamily protein YafD